MKRATKEGELSSQVRKLLQQYQDKNLLYFYKPTSSLTVGNGIRRKPPDTGISDYLIMAQGHTFYLELKTASGKQSDSQVEFQRNVTMHGCRYFICRNLESVENLILEIL